MQPDLHYEEVYSTLHASMVGQHNDGSGMVFDTTITDFMLGICTQTDAPTFISPSSLIAAGLSLPPPAGERAFTPPINVN